MLVDTVDMPMCRRVCLEGKRLRLRVSERHCLQVRLVLLLRLGLKQLGDGFTVFGQSCRTILAIWQGGIVIDACHLVDAR
jgi:hypothetical protein